MYNELQAFVLKVTLFIVGGAFVAVLFLVR